MWKIKIKIIKICLISLPIILYSQEEYLTVKDGHLYLNGKRVRFWGAVVSGANITHADNEEMAERIKRLGFNLVRFWRGYSDLTEYEKGDGTKSDLIDHFIWCLKKRGIYIWMAGAFNNLGQVNSEDVNVIVDPKTADNWKNAIGKGMNLRNNLARVWDERLEKIGITRMKIVAEHMNKWTGLKWGEDPVCAIWELSNEEWWFRKMWRGEFSKLHPFFIKELLQKWNEFLKQKYDNDENLKKSWGFLLPFESLDKENILLIPVGIPLDINSQLKALDMPTPTVEELYKIKLENNISKNLEIEVDLKENEELVFLPVFEGHGLCAATFRLEDLKIQKLPEELSFQIPKEWTGKEFGSSAGNPYILDNKPIWRFDYVYPDDFKNPENYRPMVWTLFNTIKRWGVPVGSMQEHGGQPCGFVIPSENAICLESRTPWPGKPNYKLSALIFISPYPSKYKIKAIIKPKIWAGGGPQLLLNLLRINKLTSIDIKKTYSLDDFTTQRGRDVIEFLLKIWISHKQREYEEVKKFGKSLKYGPVVLDTGIGMEYQSQFMQQHGDAIAHCTYMHGFITDPMHPRFPWFSGLEEPPLISRDHPWPEHAKHPNKPFFLYENQIEQPAKYRTEWPYRIVALGSIQDWDIIVWHITGFDQIQIAGVESPFSKKMDYSSSDNKHPQGLCFRFDEVQQSAMTAAGYIFQNFLLKPVSNPTTFIIGKKSLFDPRKADLYKTTDWRSWIPTTFRYGTRFIVDPERDEDEISGPIVKGREFLVCPLKPTDEITYDWRKGYLMFESPGTVAFVGFMANYSDKIRFKNGIIVDEIQILNPLNMPYPVTDEEKYIAFCITSTDGLPLTTTKKAILSIVSTSFNSGFKLNHEAIKKEWIWSANPGATIDKGKEPVLVSRVGLTVYAPIFNGRKYKMLDWHFNIIKEDTIKDNILKIPNDLPIFLIELE